MWYDTTSIKLRFNRSIVYSIMGDTIKLKQFEEITKQWVKYLLFPIGCICICMYNLPRKTWHNNVFSFEFSFIWRHVTNNILLQTPVPIYIFWEKLPQRKRLLTPVALKLICRSICFLLWVSDYIEQKPGKQEHKNYKEKIKTWEKELRNKEK